MKRSCHLFVIFCFLAGVIAPACGFSWGNNFDVIEICTTQGIESRIVQNSPQNPNSPEHQTKDQCEFCFQNANLKAMMPASINALNPYLSIQKAQFHSYESDFLSKTKQPQSLRGPPALI